VRISEALCTGTPGRTGCRAWSSTATTCSRFEPPPQRRWARPARDPERYREQAELDAWRARDPLVRLREHLSATGQLPERLDAIEQEIRATMHETAERAARGTPAEPALLLEDVYA